MRLFSKILSIILVLFVLSILFVPPVKAGCYFNSYYRCTGTCYCRCGGRCYCGVKWGHCMPLGCNTNCCRYNCRKYPCNSNEDWVSGSCAGIDMVCCKPRPQPTAPPRRWSWRLTHAPSWWDGMLYQRSMLSQLLRPQQHPNSCLLLRLHQRPLLHHPPRHKPYDHRCFLSKFQRLRPLEWLFIGSGSLWRLCFPGLYLPGALLYPSPNLQPVSNLLWLRSTSRRRWRGRKQHYLP